MNDSFSLTRKRTVTATKSFPFVEQGPGPPLSRSWAPSLWKKVFPLWDRGRDLVLLDTFFYDLAWKKLPLLSSAEDVSVGHCEKEREEAARNGLFPKLCKAVQSCRTHADPKLRDVCSSYPTYTLKRNEPGERSSSSIHISASNAIGFPQFSIMMMLGLSWQTTNCTQLLAAMCKCKIARFTRYDSKGHRL